MHIQWPLPGVLGAAVVMTAMAVFSGEVSTTIRIEAPET